MKKILILASNPRRDLNLDHEIRDLRDVIEKSRNRQDFEVEDALAVRVGDLQDLLFRHRPQIVHFCGHGSGQQGLVFEGTDGGEQWVRAEALSDLFRLFADSVECVLLNACYSEKQADAIVNHINYVIGMNQEIRDDAAIAFSKGFYRALGYDCAVEQAFEFGCNAIQLEISGSSRMRSAVTEEQRKAIVADAIATTVIPEHLKPILKRKSALSQNSNDSTSSTRLLLPDSQREEIHLTVAKALRKEGSPLKTGGFSNGSKKIVISIAAAVLTAMTAFAVANQFLGSNTQTSSPPTQPTLHNQTTRKINRKGLDLIEAFEGLRLEAYDDGSGVLTIGYGTTEGVRPGMKISQAQAEELLKIDLESSEAAVANMVKVPLNDDQFSALVSFVHNVGPNALANSTLLKVLNEGNYKLAADKFLVWDRAGGQTLLGINARRQAERVLFLGYDPQPFINFSKQKSGSTP